MVNDRKIKNIVKVAVSGYLFLLMFLTGSCSTTTASNPNNAVSANTNNSNTKKADQRVSLFDGRFSFVVPDGFKQLPAADVKRSLPDDVSRDNIYSNADQTAYITIELGEMPLVPADLPEVKRFTEAMHKKYSGWKTSELIDLNGRQWFHFEWEKTITEEEKNFVDPLPFEEDEPVGNSNVNTVKEKPKPEVKDRKPTYYRSYTTSLNKQMLSLSFEADTAEYPKVKEAFDKTIQTIQTKD